SWVTRPELIVPGGAKPQTAEEGRGFETPWHAVSGAYFETMGVRLLQGRTFTEIETFNAGAPPVAIIDDTLARKLWPGGSAIGQRIQYEDREAIPPAAHEFEVVGLIASTHREIFEKELPGAVYVPFSQGASGDIYFHVRL